MTDRSPIAALAKRFETLSDEECVLAESEKDDRESWRHEGRMQMASQCARELEAAIAAQVEALKTITCRSDIIRMLKGEP